MDDVRQVTQRLQDHRLMEERVNITSSQSDESVSGESQLRAPTDSVHSVEHISERAVDLRMSSMSPETSVQSPRAAGGAGIIRPIAVKLPLHAVSDRMNVDAGIELPSLPPLQRPSKTSAGTGAPGVDRFPLSVKENMTREMAEERWYDGEANSNSDDEVCDVFSRARRFQAAAAVSSWLSCDIVDGRRCVRLLRALAARGAGMARSSRWTGLPQRWLHDSRTAAVVNAVELPRPFLDFTKMQKTCLKRRRRKLDKQRRLKNAGEQYRRSSTVPAPVAPRPLPAPVLNTSPAYLAALDPAVFSFRSIWLLGAAPSSDASAMRPVG